MSRCAILGLSLAASVAAVVVVAVGSCDDQASPHSEAEPFSAADGATEPELDAPADQDFDAPADGSGGQGGLVDVECGAGGLDEWHPGGDSCWRPVDWPAPCTVQVAVQPRLAVPPLEWQPCAWGQQGCRELHVVWPQVAGWNEPVQALRVVRQPDGYRVGIRFSWGGGVTDPNDVRCTVFRAAVYGVDGIALAAWQALGVQCGCDTMVPVVGQERVWIGGSVISEQDIVAAYATPTYQTLSSVSSTVDCSVVGTRARGTDDTLAFGALLGTGAVTIYDRISNVAKTFGEPTVAEYSDPYPIGESTLLHCRLGTQFSKLCIWNRASHDIEPLVVPAGSFVQSFAADGQTMAWVQCPEAWPVDWNACQLWTSPFATHAGSLVPAPRCAAPGVVSMWAVAGDGYFAAAGENSLHVYRLSDARHWEFATPPQQNWRDLTYIDADELWYVHTGGVVRQRLDALGPGELCGGI